VTRNGAVSLAAAARGRGAARSPSRFWPWRSPRRSPAAILADTSWELDAQNNFNCTTGSSGHKTPCPIRKVGVLRIGKRSTDKTFYVNLIAGHGALPNSSQRFRPGDVAKPTRGGHLKVWHYRR
jgi:hypothetical protein